jgi:hypothetical protein
MTERLDTIGKNGLQFYSKVSAAISHDFKNALAIVNENAGLMDDYALMANQGLPIDPERLKTLAAKIAKQVGRANEIATHISRLAHSLDKPVVVVDLGETLRLLTALTSRLPQMRNVVMDTSALAHTVKVETFPFFLMTLLWRLLDSATTTDEVTAIAVAAENREGGARIILRLKGNTRKLREMLEVKQVDDFLNFLNAELTSESAGEEFYLNLPARLDALNP